MLLEAAKASLLIIDVQEKLLPAMQAEAGEQVVSNANTLLAAAEELGLPITLTEQYPRGLGHSVSAIRRAKAQIFEKISFSCWRDEALRLHFIGLHETGRPLVIVAGIEAHICVLQSAIDLHNAGFGVFVVEDAIASRKAASLQAAKQRMAACGLPLVTTEMVLFELLEKAGTPAFKALSRLVR